MTAPEAEGFIAAARAALPARACPRRVGEAWVFDDTIDHEAWNEADLPGAILIFNIWNPYFPKQSGSW